MAPEGVCGEIENLSKLPTAIGKRWVSTPMKKPTKQKYIMVETKNNKHGNRKITDSATAFITDTDMRSVTEEHADSKALLTLPIADTCKLEEDQNQAVEFLQSAKCFPTECSRALLNPAEAKHSVD